ncbi:DUF5329 family protein [Botryobacter ruber]|uniref:DUF5329 family protein n=1 Tax=Botryobacter ruber TaxID=2171629 RepID=UPI000E0A202F|nr:DUF5329 family protein [Botryobacter ruber]
MVNYIFSGAAFLLYFLFIFSASAQHSETDTARDEKPVQRLSEEQKIDQLLQYISNMQGATFIRNGSDHSPKDAAKHLRSKFRKHAAKIKTAHDFIDHLATKSSMSGDLYKVRMADGTIVETYKLLNLELQRIEGQFSP